MAWVKLDDGFSEHPKIARVGAMGAWMQIQGLCYANRNLTDGFIPFGVARAFMRAGTEYEDTTGQVWRLGETCGLSGRNVDEVNWPEVLVEAGIWEHVPGGYRIHDFDTYQPTKAQVLAERATTAERQARHRNARRNAVTSIVTHDVRNGGDNGVSAPCPVPVPVPVPDTVPENPPHASRVSPLRGGSRSTRALRTPWPDGLVLSDSDRQFALDGGLDPGLMWGAFKDHHLAMGSRFADWHRAFKMWCRRERSWADRGQRRNA